VTFSFLRRILAVSLLFAGCLAPPSRVLAQTPDSTDEATILVARRHWHIDIGFAIADLDAPLKSLAEQFPGANYLFFGFGDRHYLMAQSHNLPVLLGALWPGPGMILGTGIKATPAEAFGDAWVIELKVSSAEARSAQAFIWNSLANGESAADGKGVANDEGAASLSVTAYAKGPYEGSLYFSALPRYSAFHTCNTWAAEVLKAAGLPVRSKRVWLAGQLWSQTQKLARLNATRTGAIRELNSSGRPCPRTCETSTRRRVPTLANDSR
jgi:Protein of unknown function (DUF2459)